MIQHYTNEYFVDLLKTVARFVVARNISEASSVDLKFSGYLNFLIIFQVVRFILYNMFTIPTYL